MYIPNHYVINELFMDKQDELLKLLVLNKLINQKQLEEVKEAANFSKKPAEEILLEKKIVDYEGLTRVKASVYSMLYQNLVDKILEDNILSIIPIEVAGNYKIICFGKEDNKIKVGVTDPNNFKAIEAIDFLAKEEKLLVEYYLISDLSFNIAFKQYKSLRKEISKALKTKAEEEAEELTKIKKKEGVELEEISKTAPVAKIVSVIIKHAVEGGASDIHIEPLQNETRVRYRIDGVLGTSLILPKNIHSAIVGRIKVLAVLKLDEMRIPQDGRIRMTVGGKEIDFRVSTLPLLGEEKVVMRILDISKKVLELEDLGFMGFGLEVIKESTKKTDGMLLVTGPTGSGKSTTLLSILSKINKEGVNISTLEDPVEYFIQGVNQSQVKPEIGYNFSSGLRSLLRQDPDVIMVGEIRDNETAELAVHAGLTGHFVLSTLHTNDAIGAIPRLLDMKVEPFLLGSTLDTVVAQRLVRRICSHCKEEEKMPPDTLSDVKEELSKIAPDTLKELLPNFDINKLTFYKGAGCSRCGNSGYSKRLVVAEVINVNDKIREIIMDEKKVLKIDDIINSQKFTTIMQDGIIKVLKGLTSMEEILRVIYD
jgi:type IV pilus assembly protein PilB